MVARNLTVLLVTGRENWGYVIVKGSEKAVQPLGAAVIIGTADSAEGVVEASGNAVISPIS